jgi:hypothetical protein
LGRQAVFREKNGGRAGTDALLRLVDRLGVVLERRARPPCTEKMDLDRAEERRVVCGPAGVPATHQLLHS